MGMYTKFSISLNIFSIAGDVTSKPVHDLHRRLLNIKDMFLQTHKGRAWVCQNIEIISGLNGCVNLYGHGEIKNYDHDIEAWFKVLCENFPKAEGILYTQYEEHENPTLLLFSHGTYTLIRPDTIFEGYGNNSELDLPDAIILNLERKEI